MTSLPLKQYLKQRLLDAGASAVGFACAAPVHLDALRHFDNWIQCGDCGELDYMRRYRDLRADPRSLLQDCRTVVSVAWNYLPSKLRHPDMPFIARYAYGRDYHKALRSILKPICRDVEDIYGCQWRICIDSAPIAERFWAAWSGIGFIGKNGCLIVPGKGSWMFLTEILLTADIEPDNPSIGTCASCNACMLACPGEAIKSTASGTMVATEMCLSCATVESTHYQGLLPNRKHLLGCDRCQEVCPHNFHAIPSTWMKPLSEILTLSEEELLEMDEETFANRFAGTCLMRPGLQRLISNLQMTKRQ